MANRFILNETSYFGAGARENLVPELTGRGLKKVMFVTDKVLLECGVATKVTAELDKAGIAYEIYSDVKANPTVANVQTGVAKFKEMGADSLVAVGGGSVMDTAKAVGIIIANPDFADVVSLEGVADTKNKSVPLIALPTTSGTAAEVTINYVITDEANKKKMVCVDPKDIPVVAIVDSDLMMGMPKGLCASTGMDALTHAIEGYITKGAWELSDMVELRAIELIAGSLYDSVQGDPKARETMALAQCLAGMAFSNALLGIVHSMAHKTGAAFEGGHIIHGAANAMYLPKVIKFNAKDETAAKRYAFIADFLHLGGNTQDEKIDNLIAMLRKMNDELNIPHCIKNYGEGGLPAETGFVSEEEFKAKLHDIAANAILDACTGSNPRQPSQEEMEKLLTCCYYDTEVDF